MTSVKQVLHDLKDSSTKKLHSLKEVFQHAAQRTYSACSSLTNAVTSRVKSAIDYVANIYEAVHNPKAMTDEQRHLDEFKIVAGSALLGAGAVELNPLASAGGVIPAWEGLHDLEEAGQKWRDKHPHRKGQNHSPKA